MIIVNICLRAIGGMCQLTLYVYDIKFLVIFIQCLNEQLQSET